MPDLIQVRKKLESLASTLSGRDGFHAGLSSNHNAVELEFGQALYGAIIHNKSVSVVELGTGAGYSTTWMLLALEKNENGYLWSLDPSVPQPPVWETVGCPTGRLIYINEVLEDGYDQLPKRIDLLFHDASHDFATIIKDLELLIPRISKDGHIVVHDVNYNRRMGDALQEWFEQKSDEWTYQEISSGCGIGIAKRIAVPVVLEKPKIKQRRVKSGRQN